MRQHFTVNLFRRYLSLGLVLCLLLGGTVGCRSTGGLSDEARAAKKKSFESVTRVGSRIPQTVRKGQAASNDGPNPVSVYDGETARAMLESRNP